MFKTIKKVLLLITVSSSFFMVQAQDKPALLLTNHTFSDDKTEVGIVTLNGQTVKNAVLSGENAKAFSLKKGTLRFLSGDNNSGTGYEITISAQTTDGVVSDTFRIVKDLFIKNKVVAHRGAWKNTGETENSIGALKKAILLGCGGSEFDVHMSADSVLVINHDPDIQNIPIEKTNAKNLLSLKLANGENMPDLESYLNEGMTQNRTKLILEIKPSAISKERSIAVARRVVQLVNSLGAQAWIDYISFDYAICKEIMRLDPYARVAYLNGDKSPQELKKDNLWGYDYHFNVLKKNEDWLLEAKNQKLTTNAWTVNDRQTMEWLLNKEIDFITTNEPELLLEVLKEF